MGIRNVCYNDISISYKPSALNYNVLAMNCFPIIVWMKNTFFTLRTLVVELYSLDCVCLNGSYETNTMWS